MKARRNKPNYGFGRSLPYAGRKAISQYCQVNGKSISTEKTLQHRWNRFANHCLQVGTFDAKKIDQDTVASYCTYIHAFSPSYQQNLVSAINIAMNVFLAGEWSNIRPSKATNTRRTNIRQKPIDFTKNDVIEASKTAKDILGPQYKFLILLSFHLGLRRREAMLFEPKVALQQIKATGQIDILRGTKGGRGRSVPRLIKPGAETVELIEEMVSTFPNFRCLLLNHKKQKIENVISNRLLPILKDHGIERFHELRAAFACRRFEEETGKPAPCNTHKPFRSYRPIKHQLLKISLELGHSRVEIMNSYLGSVYGK